MKKALSPRKINTFLLFKLPSAYFCGVRLKTINQTASKVAVTHRWINQNPFKSMYFAVQAMAAELSTGALVMQAIRETDKPVSMLVAQNKAVFSKKATGKIYFTCTEAKAIQESIKKAINTGEAQTIWVASNGVDSQGDKVSEFWFEWTIKLKSKQ